MMFGGGGKSQGNLSVRSSCWYLCGCVSACVSPCVVSPAQGSCSPGMQVGLQTRVDVAGNTACGMPQHSVPLS